jgi:Zn-dependent peptidase ImmA (M78 family)
MAVNVNRIDIEVNQLLAKYEIVTAPVRVEEIAKNEGLKVTPLQLEEDVSGLLIIENEQAVIGFNKNESRVRRRFTIAHELAHYCLHREQGSLFIDKQFRAYRTSASLYNSKTQHLEQEANAFAAAILMPDVLVKIELEKNPIDLGSEDEIRKLAKLFDVSTTAMHYRLVNLKLGW